MTELPVVVTECLRGGTAVRRGLHPTKGKYCRIPGIATGSSTRNGTWMIRIQKHTLAVSVNAGYWKVPHITHFRYVMNNDKKREIFTLQVDNASI